MLPVIVSRSGNIRSLIDEPVRQFIRVLLSLKMHLNLIEVSFAGRSLKLYLVFAYRFVLFLFFVDGLLERSDLFVRLLRKDQMTGKILEVFVANQILPVVCGSWLLK